MVRAWSRVFLEAKHPQLVGHELPMSWIAALLIPWDLRKELSHEEFGLLRNRIDLALNECATWPGPETVEEFQAACDRAYTVIKDFRRSRS